jgi:uncharacterized protein
MHISQEQSERNTIQAYSDSQIQINSINYLNNFILSTKGEPKPWEITRLDQLDVAGLPPLLESKPEIILIGHNVTGKGQFAAPAVREYLSQHRIGLETLSVGAACRTFNVLLSEGRAVVLAVLFG